MRIAQALRMCWGLLLLFRARPLLTADAGEPPPEGAVLIARVLAARQLLQGAVTFAVPRPAVVRVGSWADLAHSASGVAFASLDRRRARLSLSDAAIAAGWAVVTRRLLAAHDR